MTGLKTLLPLTTGHVVVVVFLVSQSGMINELFNAGLFALKASIEASRMGCADNGHPDPMSV